MVAYLILISNASKALVYSMANQCSEENLQFITELTHAESQKKGIDLTTDRSGHYQTGHGARGAYEDPMNPKEREKDYFAKQIAEYLEEQHKKNIFQKLIVITPPHFFGLLEKHFPTSISQTISQVIQKDYTLKTASELQEILKQQYK